MNELHRSDPDGGGPRILDADAPECSAADGWLIPAGDGRVSMAYGFMIGPKGEFGISPSYWTPLHASTGTYAACSTVMSRARKRRMICAAGIRAVVQWPKCS